MKRVVFALFAAALAAGCCNHVTPVSSESAGPIRKKYVAFGWEFGNASPSNLLQVVDSLDKTALDGIGIYLNLLAADGTRRDSRKLMHDAAWTWGDVKDWVPLFRELASHRSMKECFLTSLRAPTNRIDWADDAAWTRISASMGTIARFAKVCGLKGISVDDEDYSDQFQFKRLPSDLPYEQVAALARRRGRETFGAAFREYPELTVVFFRFFSAGRPYLACNDPMGAQRDMGDLWPAFLNGILDVTPPTAKLVDGFEESYVFDSVKHDYLLGHCQQRSRLTNLAEPENRDKYRTRVSASSAIYMDMYITPPGSRYYSAPLNGSRFGHLAANLAQATYAADEYVWFWGESRCWAKWDGVKINHNKKIQHKTWEECFPGLNETMRVLKDPVGFAQTRYAEKKAAGTFKALNVNMECVKPTGKKMNTDGLCAPYSGWQQGPRKAAKDDTSWKGTFGWDDAVGEGDSSSLYMEGIRKGCITMSSANDLKPGDIYLVGASAKGQTPCVTLYWKKDGKWDFTIPGETITLSESDANGWRHAVGAVRVPANADGFGIQLGACLGKGERCRFDNVFYCRAGE